MRDNFKKFHQKYKIYYPATFFLGGFCFDLLTLGRVDDWVNLVSQLLYLVVAGGLLSHTFYENQAPQNQELPLDRLGPDTNTPFWRRWYYQWRTEAMHFAFGSLLSAYTIFYFKSASFVTSFVFLVPLLILLVANELERFQGGRLWIKYALFSLCVYSFSALVLPIFTGQINAIIFLLSMALGSGFLYGLHRIYNKLGISLATQFRNFIRPSFAVLLSFLILYFLKVLPPVPLSLQFMGIYHSVEKTREGRFRLGYTRSPWLFWQKGDQSFEAASGDKVMVFFRLFSPSTFADSVKVNWHFKDPRSGWTQQDAIQIAVVGGRDEGFRGFAQKSNYQPGEWRVSVSTTEGREIGRLRFTVSPADGEPPEIRYDEQ